MTDVRHREEASPSYSWYVRDWRASHRVRQLSWKEQGFYRACLDWAWDLDGLPNDPEYIRDRLQATRGDFQKLWPAAKRFFDLAADGRLRNARQEVERAKQGTNRRRASDGGKAGGRGRPSVDQRAPSIASSYPPTVSPTIAMPTAPHIAPPLPSPSPLPLPSPSPLPRGGGVSGTGDKQRPLWRYPRFPIFRWQVDELTAILGDHAEKLALDQWFQRLSDRATTEHLVLADPWPWVKRLTLEEAQRLGLPMGTAAVDASDATWAAIVQKGPPK